MRFDTSVLFEKQRNSSCWKCLLQGLTFLKWKHQIII